MSLSMSYSSLFPVNSQLKHNQKLSKNHKLHGIRNSENTTRLFLHNQRTASLKTYGIADYSLFLAATSEPKSGDITVFLQTSAGLFILYWITNFVVPSLLSKYFKFDEVNEDQTQKPNDKR